MRVQFVNNLIRINSLTVKKKKGKSKAAENPADGNTRSKCLLSACKTPTFFSPRIQVGTQSVKVIFCSQQSQPGPPEAGRGKYGDKFRHRCHFVGTKLCCNFCPFPVALRHAVNQDES